MDEGEYAREQMPVTLETRSTDSSTDHSMQDIQPESSDPSSSTQPTTSDTPSSAQLSRRGTNASSNSNGNARRRKVPDSVTPNACTNCKKARAKCDGAKPACKRCNNRQIAGDCHYELHAKTAKDQMMREIQRLQKKTEDLEGQKDMLGEKNERIEKIMSSLRADGQGTEVIDRLKLGESHKSIADWLGGPLMGKKSSEALSPTTERHVTAAIEQYHRGLIENHRPQFWTSVTDDSALIEHLISLYLTWIHPVHMVFDERHFMESFKACSDVYCSPSLVNVICAMSCHLLHGFFPDVERTKSGMDALRNAFLREAQTLMKTADMGKMSAIQTYAIMFLVELGSGNGLRAASHLRLAAESLIAKQTSEQTLESEEVATWGILTLHTAWSGFTYQKPSAPISTHAAPFSNIELQQGDDMWRYYKIIGDGERSSRPSFLMLTAAEHAKYLRVLHEVILVYCGTRGRVSASALLSLYERHLDWRQNLPPQLEIRGSDPLPHTFYLHIQYQCGLFHLIQPMIHLDHYRQASHEFLIQLLLSHAKIGFDLLVQYRNIYSNQYLTPLHLLCMVHLCDGLVRYGSKSIDTSDVVAFCLTSLETAKVGYALAGSLQKMFLIALSDYGVTISNELESQIDAASHIGPEEMLDACTRPSYRQPISQLLLGMDSDMGQEFANGLQEILRRRSPVQDTAKRRPHADSITRMQVGSLLNP